MGTHISEIKELLEESIENALDSFNLVQLGSRHGIYISLGAKLLAQKRPDLDNVFIGVEASAEGYLNLLTKMEKANLVSVQNSFYQVAISDSIGTLTFVENGASSHVPKNQAKSGENVVTVEATTISEIIKDIAHVDFMEMDIQGAEYKSVNFAIDLINEKVKMICIRTHGRSEDEEALESVFRDLEWQPVLLIKKGTPVNINGEEQPLDDGVQCYVNLNKRGRCNLSFPSNPASIELARSVGEADTA